MAGGHATLPPTDGATHIAFAIKAVKNTGSTGLSLTMSYAPADGFVEVIPPKGTSTHLSISYTPRSSSTSATVSPAGLVTPAPGYSVNISQMGRRVNHVEPCDFPTEAAECVGPVNPGQPILVHVAGPGSTVVIYPSWK
jgi:hypothetical protein